MRFTPVVIILAAISIVGAIAIPFGDPQFLDRAIALELSVHYPRDSDLQGLSESTLCVHPACSHCNGGELACITPCRDDDNIF